MEPSSWPPWVGDLIDGLTLIAVVISGWVAYILRQVSKDHKLLETRVAEAIKDRNDRLKDVDVRQASQDSAILQLSDRIHECQFKHASELSRTQLRSDDLKRIESNTSEIFQRLTALTANDSARAQHLKDIVDRMDRIETKVDEVRRNGHSKL